MQTKTKLIIGAIVVAAAGIPIYEKIKHEFFYPPIKLVHVPPHIEKAMGRGNQCWVCHRESMTMTGPSWAKIGERYRYLGKSGTFENFERIVKTGSRGQYFVNKGAIQAGPILYQNRHYERGLRCPSEASTITRDNLKIIFEWAKGLPPHEYHAHEMTFAKSSDPQQFSIRNEGNTFANPPKWLRDAYGDAVGKGRAFEEAERAKGNITDQGFKAPFGPQQQKQAPANTDTNSNSGTWSRDSYQ